MPIRSQANSPVAINTPLGDDVLLLLSLHGVERLGRLFRYEADMLSEDGNISFDKIVGRNVTVRADSRDGKKRYFNGFVSRFSHIGWRDRLAEYRATIVPWLWFLTRTSDCKIFHNASVPDILKKVFRDSGRSEFSDSLSGSHKPLEYRVQYCETDLDFVSRLMEREGIYYYFDHSNGTHKLVLADTASSHGPVSGYAEIPFVPPSAVGRVQGISGWVLEQEIQPGVYALKDYDFEKPKDGLLASSKMGGSDESKLEMFSYPGGYTAFSEGERYARVRLEELQAQGMVARGTGDVLGIAPGHTFTLTGVPQPAEYLVVSAEYGVESNAYDSSGKEVEGRPAYSCNFTAIKADQQYRPPRTTPRPIVHGPQTATVVGEQGKEIAADKYGRIQVRFHWDRYHEKDKTSISCPARVAQLWAGKNWGAMFIPRVGHEVVVEFLDGDPDQPIVTGSVYNADLMPPYKLPDKQTVSTVKSNSTPNGQGFNEIRFDDKKGEEQMFIHAERDQEIRVKNDCKETVMHDRHLKVVGKQFEEVDDEQHVHVKKHKQELVEGNLHLTVGGGDGGNMDLLVMKTKAETVEGDSNLHVKGKYSEKIDGKASLTAGGDLQEKVAMKYGMDAGQEIHLKAGMKVIIEAGMQLTIKGAGGFVDIGPAGVTIQGMMVKINSGGAAGSGSGSSPASPTDAKKAEPSAPTEAAEG